MVKLIGGTVKIYLGAPNPATNRLLTSPAMQAECRRVGQQVLQKVNSAVARDTGLSRGQKARRQPVMRVQPVATAFKGTVRSGVVIRGRNYGLPRRDVESAVPGLEWKG